MNLNLTCESCKHVVINGDSAKCQGAPVSLKRNAMDCPFNSYQRRIDNWLVEPFNSIMANIRRETESILSEFDTELYTPHGIRHAQHVEKMIKVIVTKCSLELSNLECFLLSATSRLHDIGMSEEITLNYINDKNLDVSVPEIRRDKHHEISCWFIQKKNDDLFRNSQENDVIDPGFKLEIARAISIIIKYHRKSEDIEGCPRNLAVKNEIVRIDLLSAIFRLADTLHKNVSRHDKRDYSVLQIASFNRNSRLHWLKSYVVSNIHLDPFTQNIKIYITLPDYNEFIDQKDKELKLRVKHSWAYRVRNLEYIIKTDIEEDLVTVNPIFSKYGIPTYVKVEINSMYIKGFSKKYYVDIDGVLSELDIIFSPNTSKVIYRTLDSLKKLTLITGKNPFTSGFNSLINQLGEVYNQRPCHLGLKKILEYISSIKNDLESPRPRINYNDAKRKLKNLFDSYEEFRNNAFRSFSGFTTEIITDIIENIVLIGYSSSVVSILENLAGLNQADKKINIYILECAPKRRLGHSNLIEYNDGIHYALDLSRFKEFNIKLIPDLGLASLLNTELQDVAPEKFLVLFGANGIDLNTGNCGHTSGHLSVAEIATKFGIDVKVISDTFKIGELSFEHLGEKRKGNWLVTQKKHIDELIEANVEIINFREDKIPFDCIKEIWTEKGEMDPEDGNFETNIEDILLPIE